MADPLPSFPRVLRGSAPTAGGDPAVAPTGAPESRSVHPNEERANAATHALGLIFGVAGAVVLVAAAIRGGGLWETLGCAVYAATLVVTYAASTLSHAFEHPRLRDLFRSVDQAAIFLFIAGSFTPIALAWLRGGPWWLLLGAMWAIALVGFLSKAVFASRVELGSVSTGLYLLLGWLPVVAIVPLLQAIPAGLAVFLLTGGACYTAGIVFFHYDRRMPYFHAAWHVLVLAGSALHYCGILMFCAAPRG